MSLHLDIAADVGHGRATVQAGPARRRSRQAVTSNQIEAAYESAVKREMQQGRDRRTALAVVQRRQPDLHLAWCQVCTTRNRQCWG